MKIANLVDLVSVTPLIDAYHTFLRVPKYSARFLDGGRTSEHIVGKHFKSVHSFVHTYIHTYIFVFQLIFPCVRQTPSQSSPVVHTYFYIERRRKTGGPPQVVFFSGRAGCRSPLQLFPGRCSFPPRVQRINKHRRRCSITRKRFAMFVDVHFMRHAGRFLGRGGRG